MLVTCLPTFLDEIDVMPFKHLSVIVVHSSKPMNRVNIMQEGVEFWDVKISSWTLLDKI